MCVWFYPFSPIVHSPGLAGAVGGKWKEAVWMTVSSQDAALMLLTTVTPLSCLDQFWGQPILSAKYRLCEGWGALGLAFQCPPWEIGHRHHCSLSLMIMLMSSMSELVLVEESSPSYVVPPRRSSSAHPQFFWACSCCSPPGSGGNWRLLRVSLGARVLVESLLVLCLLVFILCARTTTIFPCSSENFCHPHYVFFFKMWSLKVHAVFQT